MRRILETAVLLMGTAGFWGFVYPELCITEEAYAVEEGEEEALSDFLAKDGEIRIKWKSMEYIYGIKEKLDSKKDKRNDR
jgi:hypothetical protein